MVHATRFDNSSASRLPRSLRRTADRAGGVHHRTGTTSSRSSGPTCSLPHPSGNPRTDRLSRAHVD